jgi:hypothetical protein
MQRKKCGIKSALLYSKSAKSLLFPDERGGFPLFSMLFGLTE